MDFVSKALGSLAIGLPFTLSDEVPLNPSFPQPWKLFKGTLKKDSSPVSVFDYADDNQAAAKNATAVLRKLKLPGVVKHVDTVESGRHTYVVTEPVLPLDADELSTDARKFVLQSLLQSLDNLHSVAKCSHNNISPGTLMQAESSGQFVLVGFEFATFDGAPVPLAISTATQAATPPEGWSTPTLDTYHFGLLVSDLLPDESRLVNALKTQRRPTITKLATSQSAQSSLRNPLTQIVTEVSQALLMPVHELDKLCRQIDEVMDSLYPGLIEHTILPVLIMAKKPETFRTTIILISKLNTPVADDSVIAEYIVQQFSSLDRVVRLELLRYLPRYISILSAKVVQQKIMSKMAFGFADTEVVVRKASVAAVESLVDKLNSRQLNSELLRLLAKTHNDPDPEIRALTTTVLCNIAPKLENRSVIPTALGRALRDPEPKCRQAALRGVVNLDVPAKEIAEKLLGPAAGGMLDSDPQVAHEASKVTESLVQKIRQSAKLEPPAPSSQSRTTSVPPSVPTPVSTLNNASLPASAKSTSLSQPPGLFAAHSNRSNNSSHLGNSNVVDEDNEEELDEDTGDAWAWDDNEEEGSNSEPIEVDEDAWGW